MSEKRITKKQFDEMLAMIETVIEEVNNPRIARFVMLQVFSKFTRRQAVKIINKSNTTNK